ncbi:RibD C-terminal domain (plasmid) [Tsukamurella tyrosinosolvens]|uniref:Dihydrofolate reductase n=1 Tax=Tsukamurella tyrosinosolvens TaxID=57704 RepID=A0A1H4TSN4_TSUTY|nr:dihydrofolate reductase family protein [Tsukamurella tyrosinosolvens]KXO93108.1 deaminase [Tsukamurella tyrosinosolvens]MEC4613243.1 dihydrofolate reductase family protein [Tsukamurella tyrosinosolvens]RDB49764.1 deaminase [Tsukamurella tyrosinosolvens]SEC59502.1 Dihydrofolate reductase [Tsukamurella tyrosinosolvens]VEH93837.1 RibD C-terminal domain [Tsukamurella tyrosinosolvens]
MPSLIYPTNVSLDGYIEDDEGRFDWLPGDDDVFAAHTALMRSAGTLLYGRRLYEMMSVWETDPSLAGRSPAAADFAAAWRAAAKVVYSTSLTTPSTANTRIERAFDRDHVRALKAASDRDLLLGGADLAAQALAAGLIDEVQLYVLPLAVGGGKPGLPTGIRVDLELLDHRRFDSGVVLLRYSPSSR